MKTKKRTIAIGDIHGLTNWKDIVNAKENEYCRFVFLGDYFDPYEDIEQENLVSNMMEIIEFKKKHMDDVILLLGNHDMHYIDIDFPLGSRYDRSLSQYINGIFRENRDLFQYAYQEGKTIYTHAGISEAWWQDDFLPLVDASLFIYKDGILDVASLLNNANKQQLEAMYQVSYWRGGDNGNGGIFWADKNETSNDSLLGFDQVVGHTHVATVQTCNIGFNTHITYCDCLSSGKFYICPKEIESAGR